MKNSPATKGWPGVANPIPLDGRPLASKWSTIRTTDTLGNDVYIATVNAGAYLILPGANLERERQKINDAFAQYLAHAGNNYAPLVTALVNVIVGEYGMRALRGEFQKPGLPDVPAWVQHAVRILNAAGEGI